MANYTLRITQNGQSKSGQLTDNGRAQLQAERNTEYQIYDEQGQLITHPVVERSGDNLLVYANKEKDGEPELILIDYYDKNPVQNMDYVADAGNTLMTSDKAIAAVPLFASEVAAAVGSALVAGVTAVALWNRDKDGSSPSKNTESNTPEKTAESSTATLSVSIDKIDDIQLSDVKQTYTLSGSIAGLQQGDKADVWVSVNNKTPQKATVVGNTWTLAVNGTDLANEKGTFNVAASVLAINPETGATTHGKEAAVNRYNVLDNSQPVDTQPTETKPAETKPADTKPADTKPADTKPADTKPADTKPADTKPADTKPADTKPADTKPADTKPADTKPADTKPADTKPADTKPADTQPTTKLNDPSVTIIKIDPINQENRNEKSLITGKVNPNNADLDKVEVYLMIGNTKVPATVSPDKTIWFAEVENGTLVQNQGENKIVAHVEIAKGDQTAQSDNTKGKITAWNDTTTPNPDSNVDTYFVDTRISKPTITIDKAPSAIVKGQEEETYTVSGSLKNIDSDVDVNDIAVTLQINGKPVSEPIQISPSKDAWWVSLPVAELTSKDGNNEIIAGVSVQDQVQNSNASDAAPAQYIVLNEPDVTVRPIAPINQANQNGTTTLTGKVDVNNDKVDNVVVKVSINQGEPIVAQLSDDKKSWILPNVPNKDLIGDSNAPHTIVATVEIQKGTAKAENNNILSKITDPAENTAEFVVDTQISKPTITIDDVKDITQGKEQDSYTITGTLGNIDADVKLENIAISLQLKGTDDINSGTANVVTTTPNSPLSIDLAKKTWSFKVDKDWLKTNVLGEKTLTASIQVTDQAGNTAVNQQPDAKATDTFKVLADPSAPAALNKPSITIEAIPPFNAESKKSILTQIVGKFNVNNENVLPDEVQITLEVNGQKAFAVDKDSINIANGSWTALMDIATLTKQEGNVPIKAIVTINKNGQTVSADNTESPISANNVKEFVVDTQISTPEIDIKPLPNIEKGKEQDQYTVSGSLKKIDSDVDVKDVTVTLQINGKDVDVPVTVSADKTSWSANVKGSNLAANVGDQQSVSAHVSVKDHANNIATATPAQANYNVTAAKPVLPEIKIDAITEDEIALLNQFFGASQNKEITGKLVNVPAGAAPVVEVTVGGKSYKATVTGDTWRVEVPKSTLTERSKHEVVAKLTVNGASDTDTAAFYVIDPDITINNNPIHITQSNLNGTTTLTGTYDVNGADKKEVLVQIGKGTTGSGMETVLKSFSSQDADNPVILNDDNTWTITVKNSDLAFEVGDSKTLAVGAKVVFTEGTQTGDKFTSFGYQSDVVAPKTSPFIISNLVDDDGSHNLGLISSSIDVSAHNGSVSGSDGVKDTFVFSKVLDGSIAQIAHFNAHEDKLQLSSEVFSALSNTMSDFADYVQYNAATGALSYDADGKGDGAATQFAQLSKDLDIDQSHFIIA
ncbi:hypothetical protein SAMN02746062_01617 [Alysiella filiformis DSM 16848]|uniref:Uncharacterized protein n=1 Tax=Alysiella filiformis DSM 16848 TaxID=1120981 RepID=A0A286EEI2_9NEIS|nr:hypothetical protein [Alysiella filiformis]SOD69311.1 hypothetical protein SAMN02746062_01617 [Alysiella filiformis DSM 16848]